MRRYEFVTVDVFTDRRFGGNPLAVFPDARGLSDPEMQSLAGEMNLSETTFVLPADRPEHTARVRIFNRTAEMPFAGHPNVGTAYVLAGTGSVRGDSLSFEEIAGLVHVRVQREDGRVSGATIDAPQPLSLGKRMAPSVVAECVGLHASDILTGAHPPIWASVGNPYMIAQVTRAALSRAVPDLAAFRQALAAHPWLEGRFSLHLYARDGESIRARMFAPLAGTFEDPATGSANAPLAALLLSLDGAAEARYDIEQGVEMGRPSLLHTTAHRAAEGIRAAVGGCCVSVFRGEVEL